MGEESLDHGHTSLVLQPGETWSSQLRFAFAGSYEAIPDQISKAGNLGTRVLPAMVVQENTDVFVAIKSKADIDSVEFYSDNITLRDRKRLAAWTLLTFSFRGRGEKTIKFHYGDRWTNIHFYCVEEIARLIKKGADFIVEREYYENPRDPYHRYHLFLPFDHRIGSTFRDATRSQRWAGWMPSSAFPNRSSSPRRMCTIRRRGRSRRWRHTSKIVFSSTSRTRKRMLCAPHCTGSCATLRAPGATGRRSAHSRQLYRAYNYAHVANIYHAINQNGLRYGLLQRKSAKDYLLMAFHTSVRMFRSEPWGRIGVMGGSNSIHYHGGSGKRRIGARAPGATGGDAQM